MALCPCHGAHHLFFYHLDEQDPEFEKQIWPVIRGPWEKYCRFQSLAHRSYGRLDAEASRFLDEVHEFAWSMMTPSATNPLARMKWDNLILSHHSPKDPESTHVQFVCRACQLASI